MRMCTLLYIILHVRTRNLNTTKLLKWIQQHYFRFTYFRNRLWCINCTKIHILYYLSNILGLNIFSSVHIHTCTYTHAHAHAHTQCEKIHGTNFTCPHVIRIYIHNRKKLRIKKNFRICVS